MWLDRCVSRGISFARDRVMPKVKVGDLVAVLDAGAYGMSLASNYNTRGRPAEVLVDGERVRGDSVASGDGEGHACSGADAGVSSPCPLRARDRLVVVP